MNIEIVSYTPNAELVIEKFGRICYQSQVEYIQTSGENLFIKNIIKNGHFSVLEHAYVNLIISGVSRSLTHQLVRHRLATFSQKSQRYVLENNFEYIVPPTIKYNEKAIDLYKNLMKEIRSTYAMLNNLGIKKEDCRYILPNACYSEIGMTMNFRELLHVIDLRVSEKAQWEIRELFIEIWRQLFAMFPNVFNLNYFSYWSKDKRYKNDIFLSFR